jgi:hypothetical protein
VKAPNGIEIMLYKTPEQLPSGLEFRTQKAFLSDALNYVAEIGAGGVYFCIERTDDDMYNVYYDPNA